MRGHLRLHHRKACPLSAKGADTFNARACRCAPRVEARFDDQGTTLGYLDQGWRKVDLEPFEDELRDLRERRRRGTPIRAKTLGEWADEWFADLYQAALAERISKDTYNAYEQRWRLHLEAELGHYQLTAITGRVLRGALTRIAAEKGLAPRTVNELLTPVSGMLTDAVDAGLIGANPARQPRRGRHGSRRRDALYLEVRDEGAKHLEISEARALLTVCKESEFEDLYGMVLAVLTGGHRIGELLGWLAEDLMWGHGLAHISGQIKRGRRVGCKYGSERVTIFYSGLADVLASRRAAGGYVFSATDGLKPLRPDDVGPHLRAAYREVGLAKRGRLWHTLRHTFASVLADGGVRREVIEELLGHTRQDRTTTSSYIHLLADAYRDCEPVLHAAFGEDAVSTSRAPSARREAQGNSGSLPAPTKVGSGGRKRF